MIKLLLDFYESYFHTGINNVIFDKYMMNSSHSNYN